MSTKNYVLSDQPDDMERPCIHCKSRWGSHWNVEGRSACDHASPSTFYEPDQSWIPASLLRPELYRLQTQLASSTRNRDDLGALSETQRVVIAELDAKMAGLQKHLAEAQQRHAAAHAIAVEKGETIDALREKLSEVTAERDKCGIAINLHISMEAKLRNQVAELSKPSPAFVAMADALQRCLPLWEVADDDSDAHICCEITNGDVRDMLKALALANKEHPEK